jgi:hypothetical protein
LGGFSGQPLFGSNLTSFADHYPIGCQWFFDFLRFLARSAGEKPRFHGEFGGPVLPSAFIREILGFFGPIENRCVKFPWKTRFFWPIYYRAQLGLLTLITSNH